MSDFFDPFKLMAMAERCRSMSDGAGKVFDWNRAERILAERGWPDAMAGLSEDWSATSGCIARDGAPCWDDYCYLASKWATPVLVIDGALLRLQGLR